MPKNAIVFPSALLLTKSGIQASIAGWKNALEVPLNIETIKNKITINWVFSWLKNKAKANPRTEKPLTKSAITMMNFLEYRSAITPAIGPRMMLGKSEIANIEPIIAEEPTASISQNIIVMLNA